MEGNKKITSVVELARYKINDILYWVVLRPAGTHEINIPCGDEWIANCHPKVLYDRKLASKAWRFRQNVPKLRSLDFQYITELLTSDLVVEEFKVSNITRSPNTGEFYYANGDDEWMPESYLHAKKKSANAERNKIKGLFKIWVDKQSKETQ